MGLLFSFSALLATLLLVVIDGDDNGDIDNLDECDNIILVYWLRWWCIEILG